MRVRMSKLTINKIKYRPINTIEYTKIKAIIRGGKIMEMNITTITNNCEMSIVLKQRFEQAKRENWQPIVIEEDGHLVFRKTGTRKSMGQSYLEEKYGYDDEE